MPTLHENLLAVVTVHAPLLRGEGQLVQLGERLDTEVLQVSAAEKMQHADEAFEIRRDRITIDLWNKSATFRQEYPRHFEDLVDVVWHAVEVSEYSAVIVGVSFQTILHLADSEPIAYTLIGQRMIQSSYVRPEWQVLGGSCKVSYRAEDEQLWTVTIEPRFEDLQERRIFLAVNAVSPAEKRRRQEVTEAVEAVWKQVAVIVRELA